MANEVKPHRGAVSNHTGRFEPQVRERVDDGWDLGEDDLPPLRTTVTLDSTRTILARNDSPDIAFDRSINPYRGCEHGCIYCFARPSHAWLGLSPGLDFETRLLAKPDAARLLDQELRRKGYRCQPIAIGTNTDPYQPIERERRIMREVLEVLAAFDHPVVITTKSALVTRDIDILAPMAQKNLAAVGISITTLDRDLARTMEPRAAVPAKRLAAIRALSQAGVPVKVMAAPVIPFLTDAELEGILEAAAAAGAISAGYILLRLPYEIKDLVAEWLEAHAPGKKKHVLSLMTQSRDGKLYEASFGTRMRGTGTYAELLGKRFRLAVQRLGLEGNHHMAPLDVTRFRPPPRPGDQMALF